MPQGGEYGITSLFAETLQSNWCALPPRFEGLLLGEAVDCLRDACGAARYHAVAVLLSISIGSGLVHDAREGA